MPSRRWAMTPDDCRAWRELLGALALGQLGPEERAATEAHLEGCPDCRAEADALTAMAGVLRRADPEKLGPTPTPPPYLADRIARQIAPERRVTHGRRASARLPKRWHSTVFPRACPSTPASSRVRGAATSASGCTVFGRGPCARCGCAARTAPAFRRDRSATSTPGIPTSPS